MLRTSAMTALGVTGLTFGMGSATAHSGPKMKTGPTISLGDGEAVAVIERDHGRLSSIGVGFDEAALEGLPTTVTDYHLHLPAGDTGRFQTAGIDWNPDGHDPIPLYGAPHFDFHCYMLDEDAVASIPPGSPTYTIPDALMPSNTYTTDQLPAPLPSSPRAVVPAMGEHLVSMPASLASGDTWAVFIWGAYDPDGDGTGQLIFMEPMITLPFFEAMVGESDAVQSFAIPMPDRFHKAGWYPTEFVVRYDSAAETFTVALESFEHFSGYGRRG